MVRRMLMPLLVSLVVGFLVGMFSYADAAVLCANPSGGVSVRSACRSNETALNPSALGLGLSGWEQLIVETSCNNAGFCNGTASCSAGKRLLGGGAQTLTGGVPAGVEVVISASLATDSDTWFAQALTIPFTPVTFIGPQIVIQCANVD